MAAMMDTADAADDRLPAGGGAASARASERVVVGREETFNPSRGAAAPL